MIRLLHQTIAQAAEAAPDAQAFVCGPRAIGYGDLEDASNRLANLLLQQGVSIGDRVGVFMPRCVETAIAVYGILKAGAVFVPIDPHLPVGGVAQLANDCELSVILTQPSKRKSLVGIDKMVPTLTCVIGAASLDGVSDDLNCLEWSSIEDASEQVELSRPLNSEEYIM